MVQQNSPTTKLVAGSLQTVLDVITTPFDWRRCIAMALAAPPDLSSFEQKLDYIIQLLQALVQLSGEQVNLLEQILKKEIEMLTPWVASEPELIFDEEIRTAGTFYSYKMVDFRNAKRLVFKVNSTLDQGTLIQPIGNVFDDKELATDINGAWPCPANSRLSIGLAWGDWMGYVGIRITTAVAPTLGRLSIWDVIQK